MSKDDNREWEDIVRSLGGTDDQARSVPMPEPELKNPSEQPRALGPRDYVVSEPDPNFTPPTPPSPLTGSPRVVLSWCVVIFGTLAALAIGIFRIHVPAWFAIGLGLAIAAGVTSLFLLLPARGQRKQLPPDNDYGNGAQM